MTFEILINKDLKKRDEILKELTLYMNTQTSSRLRRVMLTKSLADLDWETLINKEKEKHKDDFETLFNKLVGMIPSERTYLDGRHGIRVLSKGSPDVTYLIVPCDLKPGRILIAPKYSSDEIISIKRTVDNPYQSLLKADQFFRSKDSLKVKGN